MEIERFNKNIESRYFGKADARTAPIDLKVIAVTRILHDGTYQSF